MPLLSLLFMICFFSGCVSYQDPDFDKPLIILPQDNDIVQKKEANPEKNETRAPQQQSWVEAKTSRIWVSPHVDENGDYVEGYYKYIVLDPGHWSLNGNQANHG